MAELRAETRSNPDRTQITPKRAEGRKICEADFSRRPQGAETNKQSAHRSILGEPLGWAETYPIQWREPRVDLAELAKLRWTKGLSVKQLSDMYGHTESAMYDRFRKIRFRRFALRGLSEAEREKIRRTARK